MRYGRNGEDPPRAIRGQWALWLEADYHFFPDFFCGCGGALVSDTSLFTLGLRYQHMDLDDGAGGDVHDDLTAWSLGLNYRITSAPSSASTTRGSTRRGTRRDRAQPLVLDPLLGMRHASPLASLAVFALAAAACAGRSRGPGEECGARSRGAVPRGNCPRAPSAADGAAGASTSRDARSATRRSLRATRRGRVAALVRKYGPRAGLFGEERDRVLRWLVARAPSVGCLRRGLSSDGPPAE